MVTHLSIINMPKACPYIANIDTVLYRFYDIVVAPKTKKTLKQRIYTQFYKY